MDQSEQRDSPDATDYLLELAHRLEEALAIDGWTLESQTLKLSAHGILEFVCHKEKHDPKRITLQEDAEFYEVIKSLL